MKAKTVTLPPELMQRLEPLMKVLGDKKASYVARWCIESILEMINTPAGGRKVPKIVVIVDAVWESYEKEKEKQQKQKPVVKPPAMIWDHFSRN